MMEDESNINAGLLLPRLGMVVSVWQHLRIKRSRRIVEDAAGGLQPRGTAEAASFLVSVGLKD